MESSTVAAAPAQADTSAPTISATRAAADAGNFSAFDKADLAARKGNPLPDVPTKVAPTEPPVETVAPAAVSKRQQVINDYERTIAELKAENSRLKTPPPAAPRTEPPAEVKPETKVAEWKRLSALPGAPKLADFESVEEHTAAMALFVADTRHAEREAASRQEQSVRETDAELTAHISAFDARVTELAKTDPAITDAILPLAASLHRISPAHRYIGQTVLRSEVGPQILKHFVDHPEALQRLTAPQEAFRKYEPARAIGEHMRFIDREIAKLETKFESTAAPPEPAPEPAAVPSPPTSALPPPPPVLTRPGSVADPQAAALKRGDFASWDQIETQKQKAKRGSA